MYTPVIHSVWKITVWSIPVDPENVEKNKAMNAWTLKVREKITVHGDKFLTKNSLIMRQKIAAIFITLNMSVHILKKMPKK